MFFIIIGWRYFYTGQRFSSLRGLTNEKPGRNKRKDREPSGSRSISGHLMKAVASQLETVLGGRPLLQV